jgi:hypothetical protein
MVHERVTNGEPKPERATNLSLGAAVVATINAIMAVVVNFGLNLNAQQQTSIQGLVNAIVLLVIAGSHVYGQVTAERERWSHLNGPES